MEINNKYKCVPTIKNNFMQNNNMCDTKNKTK